MDAVPHLTLHVISTFTTFTPSAAAQPADVTKGMVNIRPDVDETTEGIIAEYHDGGQSILSMTRDPNIYQQLTKSICPSVFGHDSIKQAVLLMLFGGVHKKTAEVGGSYVGRERGMGFRWLRVRKARSLSGACVAAPHPPAKARAMEKALD